MYIEIAKKRLDREDQIQKNWVARCEGKNGYLLMSNRKLLFVEEKGFLRKTYNLVLEIPYDKIDKVTVEKRDQLGLTEAGGGKHSFTIEDVNASIIEESLRKLKESASPKAAA